MQEVEFSESQKLSADKHKKISKPCLKSSLAFWHRIKYGALGPGRCLKLLAEVNYLCGDSPGVEARDTGITAAY